MRPVILGIDPKWNSLLPLLVINFVVFTTFIAFLFIYKKRPKHQDLSGRVTSRWLSPVFYEYWGWFISPFENLAVKFKLTPNFLTTVGFLFSIVSGISFATGHFGFAGWMIIIGGTFDMFDGRIARRTGMVSKSGAFYDSVMDRFGEAVVFFGLAYYFQNSWVFFVVLTALIGSVMVSYTRARGDAEGVLCRVGVMQRAERIVYLGVGSAFSPPFRQMIQPDTAEPIEYLTIAALMIIAVMTILTAFYRTFYIIRKLRLAEGKPNIEPESPLLQKLKHRYLDV